MRVATQRWLHDSLVATPSPVTRTVAASPLRSAAAAGAGGSQGGAPACFHPLPARHGRGCACACAVWAAQHAAHVHLPPHLHSPLQRPNFLQQGPSFSLFLSPPLRSASFFGFWTIFYDLVNCHQFSDLFLFLFLFVSRMLEFFVFVVMRSTSSMHGSVFEVYGFGMWNFGV